MVCPYDSSNEFKLSQKLAQAKAAKRDDNKPFTYDDIATAANVDIKTVRKFFTGEAGVDKDSAYAIAKALGLPITEVVAPDELNPLLAPEPTPVVGGICLSGIFALPEKQPYNLVLAQSGGDEET